MADPNSGSQFLKKLIEPADRELDKEWWQSKKFVAFMTTELGFFLLMGAMIYLQDMAKIGENMAFMVLAVTSGFLAVGFILGQSYLDRYVRVAKIAMGKGLLGGEEAPGPADEERDGPTD